MSGGEKKVPTALYRLFGDDDALLYIGIAKTFGKRWHQHAQVQPWWPEVRRQAIDWFPDRPSAESAEAPAIKAERPKYNIMHNPLRVAPRPEPIKRPARKQELEFAPGISMAQFMRLPVTVDIPQAARVLGLSRKEALDLVWKGQFPCPVITPGRNCRVATPRLLKTPGINLKEVRALMMEPAA